MNKCRACNEMVSVRIKRVQGCTVDSCAKCEKVLAITYCHADFDGLSDEDVDGLITDIFSGKIR